MSVTLVSGIGRLFTGREVRAGGAVVLDGGTVAWVGDGGAPPPGGLAGRITDEVDVAGALVTPGLIDAHTHPVYPRARLAEIAARAAGWRSGAGGGIAGAPGGGDGGAAAGAGGSGSEEAGIAASVRATRSLEPAALERLVARRLRRWPAGGATTVEAKTGYHLERDGELAAVRLLDRLRGAGGLPDLLVTFLAAHAPPPRDGASPDRPGGAADGRGGVPAPGTGGGGRGRGRDGGEGTGALAGVRGGQGRRGSLAADLDAYAAAVASWCADARAAGADACDVFCDAGYFSVAQARTVLVGAAAAGLRLRIHADELERTGGALLAAELGADSADHLLCATPEDARALAAAGVTATLCPGTALSLGRLPDVDALREAGVTLALGSDHNPGTCGITSMALVVTLAVTTLGLPVTGALRAATAGGAASLGLGDRGVLERGRRADLVWWDADHEGAFAWDWGLRPARVWRAGTVVA